MTFLSLALAVLAVGGDDAGRQDVPSAGTVDDVRKAVVRSLPFLEKQGMAWMETKRCASCHHVPMMLWSHSEARQRGFPVNEKAMAKAQAWALGQYLGHPEFMPTGQDKGFPKKGPGPGAVYLALGIGRNAADNPEAGAALEKLATHFAGNQEKDGSWAMKVSQPPLVDGDDVATMFILLATDQSKEGSAMRQARERALAWLRSVEPRPETQPLALRVLTAARFDQADKLQSLVTRLRERQNADGGWSQVEGRASDAIATGQALCALLAAGEPADSPNVRRALVFCVRSQREDGSWPVKTRNPNSHDEIVSYYGTGWATIGLLRSLPR